MLALQKEAPFISAVHLHWHMLSSLVVFFHAKEHIQQTAKKVVYVCGAIITSVSHVQTVSSVPAILLITVEDLQLQ